MKITRRDALAAAGALSIGLPGTFGAEARSQTGIGPMNTLLNKVLQAHGGLDNWKKGDEPRFERVAQGRPVHDEGLS